MCQNCIDPEHHISIIGPSKTESLSGYRLGVAFGSSQIIDRMEKLQAVVSLRAGGIIKPFYVHGSQNLKVG